MSPLYIDNVSARNTAFAVKLVDIRADLMDFENLVTGDEYVFFRDAYQQRRAFLINEGVIKDSFGDRLQDLEDDDWLE
jgi:phospholipid-binding lipoprotein MlaA